MGDIVLQFAGFVTQKIFQTMLKITWTVLVPDEGKKYSFHLDLANELH